MAAWPSEANRLRCGKELRTQLCEHSKRGTGNAERRGMRVNATIRRVATIPVRVDLVAPVRCPDVAARKDAGRRANFGEPRITTRNRWRIRCTEGHTCKFASATI